MVEQAVHAVVISFRSVKSAGGDDHGAFSAHVISGGVAPAASLCFVVCHKGQYHGKLSVDQVFQCPGNRIIIQGEAPYGDVCPQQLLDYLLHVVPDAAASRGFAPAGEAAKAGTDIQTVYLEFIHIEGDVPGPGAFFHSGQKGFCQFDGITFDPLGAAVDHQYFHRLWFPSNIAMQSCAHSMSIFMLRRPYSTVISQYRDFSPQSSREP